jgi:hypothetical protein
MLFALRQPATLLGLLLGFAAGCYLRATAQQALNGRLRSVGRRGPRAWSAPRYWLDPFGVVAALLAGVGWSPRPELGRRRTARNVWLVVVIAVVVHGLLAVGGLAAYIAFGGHRVLLDFVDPISVLHGSQGVASSAGQRIALGFGIENLACGLLALLPLPPLELGVAVWSVLPRSPGARRMAYRLLEEQWSIAIVLVLLLLPLAGEQPLLLQLIDNIGGDILRSIAGST